MTHEPDIEVAGGEQERVLQPTLPSPVRPCRAESTVKAPEAAPLSEQSPARKALVFPAPGERIDDFEIHRILGEGSFGKVYLARQVSLDRHVALKVTANWGSEARTLASLEHDYIVHVFSETVQAEHDLRLMCMQFVPGTTLQRIIAELGNKPRGTLSGQIVLDVLDKLSTMPTAFQPAALRDRELLVDADFVEALCLLGARLAEALDYAHRQGVLHRDVKPANILVTPYGRPMLTDFNMALQTRRDKDSAGDRCGGTLAYMAPEHLDAFSAEDASAAPRVDQRSDIYSLGVVLYELLTGRRPFQHRVDARPHVDPLLALAAQRRSCAPSAKTDSPDAPELISAIISRCLEPEPGKRYQSGGELARALEGCHEMQRIHRELPSPGRLTSFMLVRPFLWLALFTMLPHFLGSLVNISYNRMQIVSHWTPAEQERFLRFVWLYNLVVYPLCVLLAWRAVLPGFRLWRIFARGEAADNDLVTSVRRQVLTLPRWAVILSCLGWLPGGVIFPLAMYFTELASSPVNAGVWTHFLISFTISGLIALTYSYFAVQVVVLRVLYPRFWVRPSGLREKIAEELSAHPPRLWLFQLLAGTIPLAGAVLLVAAGPEVSGDRFFRVLAVGLILLGMAGFGLAVMANTFLTQTIAVLTRKGVTARDRSRSGSAPRP